MLPGMTDSLTHSLTHDELKADLTLEQLQQLGSQVGSADWYCSPDARPPNSNGGNWQDSCSKIFVTLQGGSPSAQPY